jgi:hypothetical protein
MSRGLNFLAEMRHRLDRMADGVFDVSKDPAAYDETARNEFMIAMIDDYHSPRQERNTRRKPRSLGRY